MKVCLVSFEYPPYGGGEGTYTDGLVKEYLGAGHSVVLLIPSKGDGPAAVPPGVEVVPVRVSRLPFLAVASFCLNARRLIPEAVRRGAEVVHVTFDYPTLPLDLRGFGVPVVATVHHLHFVEAVSLFRARARSLATPYFARQFLLTQAEKRTASRADGVIAVSEFTRRSLLDAGVPAGKISVVPNGVGLPGPAQDGGEGFRRMYGLGRRPYVLYVGRLDRSKGLEYLISAFEGVRRSSPDAVLVLAGRGSGGYVPALRRRARKEWTLFTGFLDRGLLWSAYAGSSVVVLPSVMEGSGISLLEGMASGRPCVATRVGGVPEVVEDGRTGLLVGPGDPEGLAAAIARVLGVLDSRTMCQEGRRRVTERFTLPAMAQRKLAAYKSVR